MSYKDTIHLPKTDFPMKANLPASEPIRLQFWEEEQVYQQLIVRNRGQKRFVLHDGPPYANGSIHFGHILNKTLKDIIVKYRNMRGYYSPFVPGWDCHGLPIELGALKTLNQSGGDRSIIEQREACRQYALHYIAEQSRDFQRLGIFADWAHPYLTLTPQYEADIAREFLRLYLDGYIYQGKKPVYWCSSCQTALAEAEVEYENVESPSIYVPFRLKQGEVEAKLGQTVHFVIWTTTPWTLPANVALAIGTNIDYGVYRTNRGIFIVARQLRESFAEAIGEKELAELLVLPGDELLRMKPICEHPFLERDVPVVSGHHVTLESGTGVVHIAPGHGLEDYQIGQKESLPTICPVDGAGKMMAEGLQEARDPAIQAWAGLFVKKLNPIIVDYLAQHGWLLSSPNLRLSHSYPHCWRCKNAVIFRATQQWFCSIDHDDLRGRALRAITGQVKWIPSWGQDRIYGMIESRTDWCLSRQRIWGVPIIIHFCTSCERPLLTREIGEAICVVFEQRGADAWWDESARLLPPGTRCECGSSEFVREQSILDVWFDSGVSHAAVLEKSDDLGSPADLYLEGSDQHRGWFHSSLLTSLATRNRAPYKTVLTHGFVVDGQGRKYSKSAQNYLPPDKVLNERGAELLRLWVGAENYSNDIRVSGEIMTVLAEIYRKIRNTCRFMLGALDGFNEQKDAVPFAAREEIDRVILHRAQILANKLYDSYENYAFHTVHHSLNRFFTVDLSAFYLDILKDRLYCGQEGGRLRRSAQSSIDDLLKILVPLMSPILSFTAEEVWHHFQKGRDLPRSVFLFRPETDLTVWNDEELNLRWSRIEGIRESVLKVLEEARKNKEIGHPLEAKIVLTAEGETHDFLKEYAEQWAQIFITSQAEVVDGLEHYQFRDPGIASLKIAFCHADGAKCERCWNYQTTVGLHTQHPTLCGRCVEVVTSS